LAEKTNRSMRLLRELAQCSFLDFDSLAADPVAELRIRHIALDLPSAQVTIAVTHKRGAIEKERVDFQGHHQETRRSGPCLDSTHQLLLGRKELTDVTSLSGQMT